MSEPRTVLMIDDDREIALGAMLRLQFAGYRALAAYDGESGVALAVEDHPDVILLDVRMPRKDSLTVLRELKQRSDTKDIPVVMVSASILDERAALDVGARFFLTKPYCGSTLLQAVTASLEGETTCSAEDQSRGSANSTPVALCAVTVTK